MDFTTLFLSHGSPMMVLEDTPTRRFLMELGRTMPKPPAVIAVSAHWQTPEPVVGFAAWPDKINDIYGFPPELYQLDYAPCGAPEVAARAAGRLGETCRRDPGAGIDHSIWSVMSLMWPEADVPVVPLSVQPRAGAAHHYFLGRRLAPLAAEGVLVIGSGAATHNLEDYYRRKVEAEVEPEVAEFTDWLAATAERGDVAALLDYRARAPHAERNHPTEEHILPFFVALGAAAHGEARRLHRDVDSGVLAMDAFGFR
ncbi:dioxygenase [Magnetospirillum sp. ME-1]|uniref:DODA-type extradiol aromatic ring-opening family dioxygenase n=1 Tax=Magnetospirillum sp. ME-1 TaxID=1639348 RepID=UPI000A17FA6C|nr:class III extradiol ring-cleavage dioxygenase [Magnetospirillum sp. ME-1]ARJ66652.1 dioxygenase [Magnetospirillum sp. ME-1]